MEERIPKVMAAVWDWRGAAPARAGEAAAAAGAKRRGALQAGVGLAIAAGLAFFRPGFALVVAAIATVTLLLALISPLGGYRRLSAVIQRIAHGVGLLLTWVLMPVIYFLVFFPLGLFLRATGKLGLTRGPDSRLASYWARTPAAPKTVDRYRRQF